MGLVKRLRPATGIVRDPPEGTPGGPGLRPGLPRRLPTPRHASPGVREYADLDGKPDLLLYALAAMIWTYVWRVQDLFPVLGMLRINMLSAAMAIGLFAIDRDPRRSVARLRTPILICALGLLAVAILGVPMSLWPRRSATFLLIDFCPNLVLMVLLAASVRGMRDLEWIALVNLLGAGVHALFVYLSFDVGPNGRLGDLVYYDANDLALVLVCTIPFAVYFLVRGGWRHRVLALGSLLLFIATLVKSGSRGGFLGFVAVLVFVLVRYVAIPKRTRLLAVVSGFGLLSLVAGDAYWEKIRSLTNPQQDYNWSGNSTEGRMEVWKRGVGYMADHPFLGVGMRNFAMAEGMLSKESRARMERGAGFKWSVAHNSFVEIGAEMGVVGLALFLGILVSALRSLHRLRRARPSRDPATIREVALASTLSASFIGFIVSGFFISAWYFSYLYMLLAVVMGFMKVDRFAPWRFAGWRDARRPVDRRGRPISPLGGRAAAADALRLLQRRPVAGRHQWRGEPG